MYETPRVTGAFCDREFYYCEHFLSSCRSTPRLRFQFKLALLALRAAAAELLPASPTLKRSLKLNFKESRVSAGFLPAWSVRRGWVREKGCEAAETPLPDPAPLWMLPRRRLGLLPVAPSVLQMRSCL